jgi:hypothetical protein
MMLNNRPVKKPATLKQHGCAVYGTLHEHACKCSTKLMLKPADEPTNSNVKNANHCNVTKMMYLIVAI